MGSEDYITRHGFKQEYLTQYKAIVTCLLPIFLAVQFPSFTQLSVAIHLVCTPYQLKNCPNIQQLLSKC